MDPDGLFLSSVDITTQWEGSEVPVMVLAEGVEAAPRGAPSCCPFCGNQTRALDAKEAQGRHLNSLPSKAYLYAVIPQVPAQKHRPGTRSIEVPWARTGSEFTQLFEALVMALLRQIPVKTAAAILGTSDARLWRLVDHESGNAVSVPCAAGSPVIERRSGSKGRDFLNLFYDLDVSFETPIKETLGVRVGTEQSEIHKEIARNLGSGTRELSKAFILAAVATLVRAALSYRHFRSTKVLNDALGKVGAEEGMLYPSLSRAPPLSV